MWGGLLLLGYQIVPLFHLSAALHTHAKMRIKAKVYFGRPRTVLITSFSRGLADSRVRVQAIFWDRASQVGGPAHVLSSSVRTLQRLSILWMLRGRGWCARDGTEQNAESEEAFRLLLLIGNVLKTDSKTKPTSKLNCRVIIVMSRVQKETSFRHLLEQLRAMNEHDETAPAAFRFLYSTLSKHMDAYFSSLLL